MLSLYLFTYILIIVVFYILYRCFLRDLRLCCVSSVELNPVVGLPPVGLPPAIPTDNTQALAATSLSSPERVSKPSRLSTGQANDNELKQHDIRMAKQSVRNCIMLSPTLLIDRLSPTTTTSTTSSSKDLDAPLHAPQPHAADPLLYMVIDLRSEDDIERHGGCTFPTAVTLDPEFLSKPDVLDSWLQHFDSVKGEFCLCIVDMPPVKTPDRSLWRRLLLGEGDGVGNASGLETEYDTSGRINSHSVRDLDSQFIAYEDEAQLENSRRPAFALAHTLQRNHFPYVCCLEGGLPALVEHLVASRGSVEPVLINHDHSIWLKFLHSHGYATSIPTPTTITSPWNKPQTSDDTTTTADPPQSIDTLTEGEAVSLAYTVSRRLGHEYMSRILYKRLNKLDEEEENV